MDKEKYSPGSPDLCESNPECCDECDHFLECFPNWQNITKNPEESV